MSAPTFALLMGLAFTGAGLLGFIPSMVLDGRLLGLFPVNALYNVVHFAVGFAGLSAWAGALSAVTYARALAVFFGVLAVAGLIPATQTLFGLVPLHGHGVWLHGLTAAAAAYIGFRSSLRRSAAAPAVRQERRRSLPNRRVSNLAVALERRRGEYDRRHATFGGAPLSAG